MSEIGGSYLARRNDKYRDGTENEEMMLDDVDLKKDRFEKYRDQQRSKRNSSFSTALGALEESVPDIATRIGILTAQDTGHRVLESPGLFATALGALAESVPDIPTRISILTARGTGHRVLESPHLFATALGALAESVPDIATRISILTARDTGHRVLESPHLFATAFGVGDFSSIEDFCNMLNGMNGTRILGGSPMCSDLKGLRAFSDKEMIMILRAEAFPGLIADALGVEHRGSVNEYPMVKWHSRFHARKDFARLHMGNPLCCDPNAILTHMISGRFSPSAEPWALKAISAAKTAKELLGVASDIEKASSLSLYWASRNGDLEKVETHLAAGAKVDEEDSDSRTPLHWASRNGDVRVVKALLAEKAEVDKPDWHGRTPLFLASNNGHASVVKALLNAKAKVDKANRRDQTPLHWASYNGDLHMVTTLLRRYAVVDKANDEGSTPLYLASHAGHAGVVKVLLAYNADVRKANNVGETPLSRALRHNHTEIVALLHAAGATE